METWTRPKPELLRRLLVGQELNGHGPNTGGPVSRSGPTGLSVTFRSDVPQGQRPRVSAEAKLNGDLNRPADTPDGTDPAAGRPAAPGQTGLDRANQTPAAGHAPTAVPTGRPASAGAQSSAGLGTASSTPAAGFIPSSAPPARPGR